MPIVDHAPHRVTAPDELVAHLATLHGYVPEMIEGGTRTFLETVHLRAHHHMAEDPPTTAAELAGTAERLSAGALETLEALRPLDREFALRLAGRWAAALNALASA